MLLPASPGRSIIARALLVLSRHDPKGMMTELAFEVAAGGLLFRMRRDQAGVQVGHDVHQQPTQPGRSDPADQPRPARP